MIGIDTIPVMERHIFYRLLPLVNLKASPEQHTRRGSVARGRKQNASESNIQVDDSGKTARKRPTQQQPIWRTEMRGGPRAFAKCARTG
ncbi:MAG TPA: hypothetical protein VHT02_08390 [Methylocella sp.]|jgi:hypothetical protein|nr:hypothetical protein [Methylocella sp.]